jgi:hypothetical protein
VHEIAQDARISAPRERDIPAVRTTLNENSRIVRTRGQLCGPGAMGASSPNADSATRYVPAKKMPALTRPRSLGPTTNLNAKRIPSSAMATMGSGHCEDHS